MANDNLKIQLQTFSDQMKPASVPKNQWPKPESGFIQSPIPPGNPEVVEKMKQQRIMEEKVKRENPDMPSWLFSQ